VFIYTLLIMKALEDGRPEFEETKTKCI